MTRSGIAAQSGAARRGADRRGGPRPRRSTHSAAVANSDPVAGLAGPDGEPDGQVGFAGAGRPEEHDVVLAFDEVEGAEVGDRRRV